MLPNERSLLQQHRSGVISQTATAVFAFPLPPSSVSARWQLFPSSHRAYSFAVLSIPRLLTMKRHFHWNTQKTGCDAEQCLKKKLKERKSHLKLTIMVPNSHQKLAEPKMTLPLITAFFLIWTAARHLKQHFITMIVLLLVMIDSWDHIRSRSNILLVSRL